MSSLLAYPLGLRPQVPTAGELPQVQVSPVKRPNIPTSGEIPTFGVAPAPVPPSPAPTPPPVPAPNPHPGDTAQPPANLLPPNPQLPAHPLLARDDRAILDAQYEAQQAQLAQEISQRYNDVLQQLGYMDPASGAFVPGTVEIQAARTRADALRGMGLAGEEQTKARQLEGTLFSGRRATEQARAEHPFVQALADLDVDTPRQLSQLYEQGGGLISEYTNRLNLLLADAARRRSDAITRSSQPGAAIGGFDGSPGGGDPNEIVQHSMPDGSGMRYMTRAEADAVDAAWWAQHPLGGTPPTDTGGALPPAAPPNFTGPYSPI